MGSGAHLIVTRWIVEGVTGKTKITDSYKQSRQATYPIDIQIPPEKVF